MHKSSGLSWRHETQLCGSKGARGLREIASLGQRGSAKAYSFCYGCTEGVKEDGRAKQLLQDRAVRPDEEERPAIPNSGPASIATKIDPQRPFSGEISRATAKAEPEEIQL